MKTKLRNELILIAAGVAMFALFMNLGSVFAALDSLIDLLMPILVGLVIAFILNVPMSALERRLGRMFKISKEKSLDALALLLTLLAIVLVIAATFSLLVPSLANSISSIIPLMEEKVPEWMELLNSYGIDTSQLTDWLASLNLGEYTTNLTSWFGLIASKVKSTVSYVINGVFGLIIAIYILISKKRLSRQIRNLLMACLPAAKVHSFFGVCRLIQETYARFLSGQCLEAIILGCLMCAAFSICGFPYAALIGVLTAVCAFVPYVGAFFSGFVGFFLILLVSPQKAILSIAVYACVQFVENQFIYPNVVGGSVGLSPLWTLIAALIGGKLFGLIGIIFFIPLAAVVYTLGSRFVSQRLEKKQIEPA